MESESLNMIMTSSRRADVVRRAIDVVLVLSSVSALLGFSAFPASASSKSETWYRLLWTCATPPMKPVAYSSAGQRREIIGLFKAKVTRDERAEVGSWLDGNLAYCVGSFSETSVSGKPALVIYSSGKQERLYRSFAIHLLKGSEEFKRVEAVS